MSRPFPRTLHPPQPEDQTCPTVVSIQNSLAEPAQEIRIAIFVVRGGISWRRRLFEENPSLTKTGVCIPLPIVPMYTHEGGADLDLCRFHLSNRSVRTPSPGPPA